MKSELKANKWAIALTVMLPTFIEIMDTSVVNVSLPHIQGSLNAGLDEVTWVLTSYLVSNAIIIPISGWLSAVSVESAICYSAFFCCGELRFMRRRAITGGSCPCKDSSGSVAEDSNAVPGDLAGDISTV